MDIHPLTLAHGWMTSKLCQSPFPVVISLSLSSAFWKRTGFPLFSLHSAERAACSGLFLLPDNEQCCNNIIAYYYRLILRRKLISSPSQK